MTLSMAPIGKSMLIKKINGKDDTRKFLTNLGFVEGSNVRIVSELNGSIILNVKDTRIAVDKTITNRIIVTEKCI